MTTRSVHDDDRTDPNVLDDQEFDALFDGLPEEMRNIRADKIAGEPPAAPQPPGLFAVPEGRVMLTNIRFPNERFFPARVLPDVQGGQQRVFAADRPLEFTDGHLVCTETQAQEILQYCPYVKEEPREGPIFTFKPDGFQTRNPEVFAEYSERWAQDQV